MKTKNLALGALLVGIAITGPLVAYAGVSVIYPKSDKTLDIDTAPPITFAAGTDYATAQTAGLLSAFTSKHNGGAYDMTVFGLSGGNITIDNLTVISAEAAVASYKVEVATAASGTLTFDDLTIRLWDPSVNANPPGSNAAANVCAVLDLTSAVNTESSASCTAATIHVQLVYDLDDATQYTTESDSVSVRPSSITFS